MNEETSSRIRFSVGSHVPRPVEVIEERKEQANTEQDTHEVKTAAAFRRRGV